MTALPRMLHSPFGAAPQLIDVTEADPQLFTEPLPQPETPDPWLAAPEIDVERAVRANRRLAAWSSGRQAIPYDALRTKLQQRARANGWSSLAVTSASPGTGKSTLVANLALAFARGGAERVLVLELNQRKPALASLFSLSPRSDISQVMAGELALTDQAHRIGQNVMFSFSQIRPRGLLETRDPWEIKAALDRLSEEYQPDLVLIDLPHVYADNGVFGLLAHVSAALVVARQNHCRMADLDQCEHDIAAQTDFAGFVVSQA